MDDDAMTKASESQCCLLCRRYLLVHFGTLSVRVLEGSTAIDRDVLWAFGVLADGQYESLGVWPVSGARAEVWRMALEDLKVRGVEQIRIIQTQDLAAVQPVLSAAYPSAKFLPSPSSQGGPKAIAGEDAARELQGRASQSVRRHGCFVDLFGATVFVANALRRAERRSNAISAKADGLVKHLVDPASRTSNYSKTRAVRL